MGSIPRKAAYLRLKEQKTGVMGTIPLYNRIVLLVNRRLEEAQELQNIFSGLPVCAGTNKQYEAYNKRFSARFPIQQFQLDRLEQAQIRRDNR